MDHELRNGPAFTRRRVVGMAAASLALATRARGAIAAQAATPEDFGAVSDLDGDNGTDNTAAFLALARFINATGGLARIGGRYRITRGFPIFAGTWEFADKALVRNTTRDGKGFWTNTCVFIGTYFGYGPRDFGLTMEPAYPVLPLAAGAARVRFAQPADAGHFPAGSLIFLTDANTYPGPGGRQTLFARSSHGSRVIANPGDGSLTLRDPLPLAIAAKGAVLPEARTDAGTVPIASLDGVPGNMARIARGVTIVNGAFESAAMGRSQAVHVACVDSNLDFRWVSGYECLGLNPVMDSTISVRDAGYSATLFELAYDHFRVKAPVLFGRRVGQVPANLVPIIAVSEWGHSVAIGSIDVSDYAVPGDYPFRVAISVLTPMTSIQAAIVRGAQYAALNIGALGTRANGSRVGVLKVVGYGSRAGAPGAAIVIDADDVKVSSLDVSGLARGGVAARFSADSGRNVSIGDIQVEGSDPGAQPKRLDDRRSAAMRVPGTP
ncbi:MAG: hypothetical protein KGL48_03390 [Sphingomonadales bacterium]|nr:hypothetical protein [Sphingomonadales bacterium]MDE2567944.1 hypothetical protein [Sphingomonadales bacterium]